MTHIWGLSFVVFKDCSCVQTDSPTRLFDPMDLKLVVFIDARLITALYRKKVYDIFFSFYVMCKEGQST